MATSKPPTRPAGRDSGTGQFIPVEQARRDKQGAQVERIPVRSPAPPAPRSKK